MGFLENAANIAHFQASFWMKFFTHRTLEIHACVKEANIAPS